MEEGEGRGREETSTAVSSVGMPEGEGWGGPWGWGDARVEAEACRDHPLAGGGALGKVHFGAGDRMELRGLGQEQWGSGGLGVGSPGLLYNWLGAGCAENTTESG